MKVIFEEYSGVIIIGIVIVALIAIVSLLLATDGPVHAAFVNMVNGLLQKTGVATPTGVCFMG